jgi:hypothetical protein
VYRKLKRAHPMMRPIFLPLWLSEAQAGIFVLELRHAAAGIQELGRTAGPSRVHGGINVQSHLIAFLAPSGAGLEYSAIGHFDVDGVIIGVNICFHLSGPYALAGAL